MHELFASGFRASPYAMFGFLLVALVCQTIIVSLLSIISTYMQLCSQDYAWWWKSFTIGASGSIFLGLELFFMTIRRMDLSQWASDAIILINSAMFLGCYMCATGYIGVAASYKFISILY